MNPEQTTVDVTCASCENVETISKDEFEASLSIEEDGITRVCPNCGATQLIQQSDTTPPADTSLDITPDDLYEAGYRNPNISESELIIEPVAENLDALAVKQSKSVHSQLMRRVTTFKAKKVNEVI